MAKKIVFLCRVVLVLLCLIIPALAFGADTFSVTVPAGTEVTMQNPASVLPVTVTNNPGSTKYIRELTFKVNTAKYNISASTVPPPGWCIKDVGTGEITFALIQPGGACSNGTTASQISPGASLVFNITVLPLAASADVAGDTFTSVTVDTQGGFSLSGSLPAWTRRSLDVLMSATPASTGIGSEITLTMQATNRSTVTQGTINSTPSPPSASAPIVTFTAGPYYGSTVLASDITASDTTIAVASATEFPASGTARINTEDICYSGKTATTLTGATRGCNATTAGSHLTNTPVYSLTPFSLAPDQTGTLIWKYSADLAGTVDFTARATNSSGTAKSVNSNSNTVVIGDFTAALALSPTTVISGENITVRMTVSNNGSTSLINVAPSALTPCGGGATETLVSGPAPADVSSLAPGSSAVFYWTYNIAGSIGQSYCLSGSATANGPVSTNMATSNSGAVSNYSATVAPSVIASGTANQSFTWTVYNGSGCSVKEVDITTPALGGKWICASVTPPAGWSGSCSGTVQFKSPSSGADIPSGGTKSFSITFSTTETVTSDKVVTFPVLPAPRGGCGGSEGTIGTNVTVTANGTVLTHSPAGPIYADGSAMYTMTATLTSGGNPLSGKVITFTTTNGSLSSSTATTNASGQATVNLVAPNSTANTTATVTASYINSLATDTVGFNAWTKANLQYWGGLAPASVNCGSPYSFTMTITNISITTPMTLGTGSYFAFNDSSAGGSTIFMAYLNSAVTLQRSPLPGSTQTLTFGSPTNAGGGGGVAVPSSFIAGTYLPLANPAPPPASGLFFTDGGANDQHRSVADNITVSGDCGTVSVNIIEWHEMP